MSGVGADADLLARIEAYCDAAPRPAADVEEHGALTLFVSRIPWRYYGRPRLGLSDDVPASDVAAVRARQRELGVREAFEWVHETTPSFAGAAEAAGLAVTQVPLLALDAFTPASVPDAVAVERFGTDAWTSVDAPDGVTVELLDDGDEDALRDAQAAIELAFAADGMDAGEAGVEERELTAARLGDLSFLRDRLRSGLTAMAAAVREPDGVVGAGSHHPVAGVTEVTGVGTLPAARGRGIGAALTGRLVRDARERGAEIVFLSAADDRVAGLYERLGFRRIGTACFGRPPE